MLQSKLLQLKMNQSELARRLGIHRNSVSRMVSGRLKTPQYVLAYVDLLIKIRDAAT